MKAGEIWRDRKSDKKARLIIVEVKQDMVKYRTEGGTGEIRKTVIQKITAFYERDYSGESNEGIL